MSTKFVLATVLALSLTSGQAFAEGEGNSAQPSSLARLEPAFGNEAAIQTANSLPRGSGSGAVAYAQARSVNRYLAARPLAARILEAGIVRSGE